MADTRALTAASLSSPGRPDHPPGWLAAEGERQDSQHHLLKDEGPAAPTCRGPCGAARARFALMEVSGVLKEVRQHLWVQQLPSCAHPPTAHADSKFPSTLLISLCLSLLTISSSTSPSPLISLENKHRPMSCEGYWQINASPATPPSAGFAANSSAPPPAPAKPFITQSSGLVLAAPGNCRAIPKEEPVWALKSSQSRENLAEQIPSSVGGGSHLPT